MLLVVGYLSLAAPLESDWPNLCVTNNTLPYSDTRCDDDATCCSMPFSNSGMGCCPWKNAVCCPNNKYTCCPEGTACVNNGTGFNAVTTCVDSAGSPVVMGKSVCKPGPQLPFSTTLPNIIVMGDSVSIGYTPVVAQEMQAEAFVQHSPWAGDGGAEETAYGVQCLKYFASSPSGLPLQPDILVFNWGLHNGPLGNDTVPGQQGNTSQYKAQLRTIATGLQELMPNTKFVFMLTTPVVCSISQTGCVQNLNNQATDVMNELNIPVLDMFTPVADVCGPLPNATCFGKANCFCPHCPGIGYEFMANSTIVPALRKMLQQ